MSRFTTQRYEKPFQPAYTMQGLTALSNEIQTGFEEFEMLQRLKSHLQRLDQGYKPVTSAEQLMIASSIHAVMGQKSELALSLEAVQLTNHFDTQVSLEGVGKMIKDGIDWLVKKIKEFFSFLGNLIRKLLGDDEKKAQKYKEASKFDFEKKNEEFAEDLARMRRAREEHKRKMAEAFEQSKRHNDSYEEMRKKMDDIRDQFSEAFEKDREANADMARLLRMARADVSGTGNANQGDYKLGGNRRVPFTNAKEFVEFTDIAGKQIPTKMNALLKMKLHINQTATIQDVKQAANAINSIRGLDKYYEEHDEDGISYLGVKRLPDAKPIFVSNTDMIYILTSCSDGLIDIKTCLNKIRLAETNANLTGDLETVEGEEASEFIKAAKIWLKLLNIYTKTLVDTRGMIVMIGDDALAAIHSLK